MTDPIPPTTEPQDGPPPANPPWGTNEQFDPAKAWNLIQNLRGDVEKQKARVAELTPYEQKMRELEDAQKTEVQKAAERAAAAEKLASDKDVELLRLRTALTHGISDEDAAIFLTASDQETLTKQAGRLVALQGQQQSPAVPRTPLEALRPGALPNPPEPTIADQIATAEKAGDWATARRLKSHQLMELQRNTK